MVHKPNGQWPKGVGGNLYKPRRRRAALELIAAYTDGGRLLVDSMFTMAGLPTPGADPNAAPRALYGELVQFRARKHLWDFFFGKRYQVSGKVRSEVVHTLDPTPRRDVIDPRTLTDEELAVFEGVRRRMLAAPPVDPTVEDAVVATDDEVETDE